MNEKIYIKPKRGSSKTDLLPFVCLMQIMLKGKVDFKSIKNIYNKIYLEEIVLNEKVYM
jgi:hypothetical protein